MTLSGIRCALGALFLSIIISSFALAQSTVTYTGATGGDWLSSSNWNTAIVPGAGTIALINNAANWIGFDLSGPTNNSAHNQLVGAITYSGSTSSFTLGNTSTTDDGTLTLGGVGGASAGILLRNTVARTLTIANTAGSGSRLMSLTLASSGSINVATGGTIAISTAINQIGANRSIIKTGGGVLRLSAANTYAGDTTLIDGTTIIDDAAAFGTSSNDLLLTDAVGASNCELSLGTSGMTLARKLNIRAGSGGVATLSFSSASSASTFSGNVALNKSAAITTQGGTLGFSGVISGAGGMTLSSSNGGFALSNANTFDGPVSFTGTGSRLLISSNSALGSTVGETTISTGNAAAFRGGISYTTTESLFINGSGIGGTGAIENLSGANSFAGIVTVITDSTIGVTSGALTLDGILTGPFNLTKVGAGTLLLTNSSNNFGTAKGMLISTGAVQVSSSGALGNATFTVGNAIFSYAGANTSTPRVIVLAPNANAAIEVKSAATLSLSSASALTGTGASLTKLGIGTLQLTQPATYTGSTTIANGSVRMINGDNRLPTSTWLTMGDSVAGTVGTLDLNDKNQTVAALSGVASGNQILNLTGAATPTVTVNQTASTTYAGRLGGGASGNSLALTKSGTGTLILTGANTYTGTTTVSGGALIVDGTHGATGGGAGDYAISAGGMLGGSGAITFASGKKLSIAGRISPGDSPGILAVNGTTDFAPGGKYAWQFSPMLGLPGSEWDLLQLTTATMSATTIAKFTIEIESLGAAVPDSNLYPMTIATSTNHSFTQAMLDLIALDTSKVAGQFTKPWTLSVQDSGGAIVLTYTPEPSVLGVVALVAWASRPRRTPLSRADMP